MITSRFAPAPTGLLHLGHVVNAIYVWGITRAMGGQVLLRIEDHDRVRSRAEYERAILDDLVWLGFVESAADAVRQSDRADHYERALRGLAERGLIYACECSRREIVAASGEVGAAELRYPGTCSTKNLSWRPGLALRVRLEPSIEHFVDGLHGTLEQHPAEQCGDVVVRDRDGNWTYQFAVAVDDWEQGVTHVIRGDDLLASTGRQIQLARLLGRPVPPRFVHHPLVMKSPTQKLSKADGDTSIRDLRASGLTAADVVGRAAHLAGMATSAAPLGAGTLSTLSTLRDLAARL